MIANNTRKAAINYFNLEVHNVIKYTQKHRATVIISCEAGFLCDIISMQKP